MTTSLTLTVLGTESTLPPLVDLAAGIPAAVRVVGGSEPLLRKGLALGAVSAGLLPGGGTMPDDAGPAPLSLESVAGPASSGVVVTDVEDLPESVRTVAPIEVNSAEELAQAVAASAESVVVLLYLGPLPEGRTPGLKDIMAAKKVELQRVGEDAESRSASNVAPADSATPDIPSDPDGRTVPPPEQAAIPQTTESVPEPVAEASGEAEQNLSPHTDTGTGIQPVSSIQAASPVPPEEPAPSKPRESHANANAVAEHAPSGRERKPRTRRGIGLAWLVGAILVVVLAVLVARGLLSLQPIKDFISTYPGAAPQPQNTPVGLPGWLGWQHFLNAFFMVLIVSTGLKIRRETRPPGTWTSRRSGKKISLTVWMHQSIDLLWLLNGVVFIVLLFSTGQWMRLVPTDWAVVPNALSAGLQYLSLDWPTENGWVVYNALQQLAYFATVFIAAPLAALSGWRMSSVWPAKLSKALPMRFARAVHFPVMLYFVVFVVVHVGLVLATGMKRNLGHIFAATDAGGWAGFVTFVVAVLVMVGGWALARPTMAAPVARVFGNVSSR